MPGARIIGNGHRLEHRRLFLNIKKYCTGTGHPEKLWKPRMGFVVSFQDSVG